MLRSLRHAPGWGRNDRCRGAVAVLVLVSVVCLTTADLTEAHDLERTRVSLTFARDGAFVLDVTNDLNWLKLRLESFSTGRRDPAMLGNTFIDRVVLFVDGHEVRPTSAELLLGRAGVSGADASLATYRLRGRMPPGSRTVRWYYGLVIDPYPLAVHLPDGRTISETVYGDAWSRPLDVSGQFDRRSRFPSDIARQWPIVLMLVGFTAALTVRLRGTSRTCGAALQVCPARQA